MAANESSEEQRNKAVVRRFVDEYQTGRDSAVFDELVHPDFVDLSPDPGGGTDAGAAKESLESFFAGFPDCSWTIEDMIAEGDRVATKKTFSGTHTAEIYGIPATGRKVTLTYVDILRLQDGKIVEHWYAMDQLSFMQQLGVMETEDATA